MHKAIKVLILASIFLNFSVGLFGPIYAIFVEKIGGDIFLIPISPYCLSLLILSLPGPGDTRKAVQIL